VTAVRSLGNGSQVLVCGFAGMSLYDVRMPKALLVHPHGKRSPSTSVLDLPFQTSFPSNAMDIWQEMNVVATADDDNKIQMHSLTSGKLLGSLTSPDCHNDGRIQKMRFMENHDKRPTLTVCQGSKLAAWSWGGDADDEG